MEGTNKEEVGKCEISWRRMLNGVNEDLGAGVQVSSRRQSHDRESLWRLTQCATSSLLPKCERGCR